MFFSLLALLGGIFREGWEVSLGGEASVGFVSFLDVFGVLCAMRGFLPAGFVPGLFAPERGRLPEF